MSCVYQIGRVERKRFYDGLMASQPFNGLYHNGRAFPWIYHEIASKIAVWAHTSQSSSWSAFEKRLLKPIQIVIRFRLFKRAFTYLTFEFAFFCWSETLTWTDRMARDGNRWHLLNDPNLVHYAFDYGLKSFSPKHEKYPTGKSKEAPQSGGQQH